MGVHLNDQTTSQSNKKNAKRLPSWWKDCRMFHQGLNIQQSKQWKRLRAPRSCIRGQDEEFFPEVCWSTPNGKSVGKHGRCPVFPNGVVSRSAVSAMAHNSMIVASTWSQPWTPKMIYTSIHSTEKCRIIIQSWQKQRNVTMFIFFAIFKSCLVDLLTFFSIPLGPAWLIACQKKHTHTHNMRRWTFFAHLCPVESAVQPCNGIAIKLGIS